MAHQPLAAVVGQLVGMAGEQSCDFRLDGLRQQRSRATAQHLRQRIDKTSWLGKLENVSLGHGVSLLCWRSGGVEHPHDTPPYPFTPSPTFDHSSSSGTFGLMEQWMMPLVWKTELGVARNIAFSAQLGRLITYHVISRSSGYPPRRGARSTR